MSEGMEIIPTLEETKEKSGRGKTVSLIGQIIAAVWIASWSSFKFFKNPGTIEIIDVIISGISIAACFSPVYVSIIMDKIKDIKIGGVK